MVFHHKALERIREARQKFAEKRLERRQESEVLELRKEKEKEFVELERFQRERQRLKREGQLEAGRAKIRKSQAISRPPPRPGFFSQAFGQRSGPQAPPRGVIRRKVPRKAARGRVLFNAQGRPVSVRNAPAVRRARRRRRAAPRQQSPLAPSFRF